MLKAKLLTKTDSLLIWLQVGWLSLLLVLVTLIVTIWSFAPRGDTRLYHAYASTIGQGYLPYRDFGLEYPPGVLPLILLAGLIGLAVGYQLGFGLLVAIALTFFFWHRYRVGGLRAVLQILLLLLPVLQFVFFDLDIFASLALYGAIYTLLKRQSRPSAILLGIAP